MNKKIIEARHPLIDKTVEKETRDTEIHEKIIEVFPPLIDKTAVIGMSSTKIYGEIVEAHHLLKVTVLLMKDE